MTYTAIAVLCVPLALVLDRWIARTRLTSSADWWSAYAIIVFFQLLTNGWLTGRRIVTYDPAATIGDGQVVLLGHGRIAYAPVEDLGFGFALVLLTCVLWTWWARRGLDGPDGDERDGGGDEGAPRG